MAHAAVIGGGSWETALAKALADKGENVVLWARDRELVSRIHETRINDKYLPSVRLPDNLSATSDLSAALTNSTMLLVVVPSHTLRETMHAMKRVGIPRDVPIVSATKGIENSTLQLMSEVLEEELGHDYHNQLAYLSGPSFAKEVARGHPTVIVLASQNETVSKELQHRFSSERLRAYSSTDVVGVEVGGALKNVIAIAAGAVDGLELGHNARAALITRGLAEMARVAMAKGGNVLTLAGLAGMGDLVLTCTGEASRNRSVGLELGKGRKIADILAGMTQVAEGVKTAKSAYDLASRLGVNLPIVSEVYKVIYEDKPTRQAVFDLMTRELGTEF